MALHEVIERGDVEQLRALLRTGADPNERGPFGRTPLMTAIQHRRLDCLVALLDAGADPELMDDFNTTALRAAVQHDWPDGVAELLRRGVDLGRHPRYPLEPMDVRGILDRLPNAPELEGPLRDLAAVEEQVRESLAAARETPSPVIADVRSVAVLRLLLDAGEDLADADREVRRELIGLLQSAPIEADAEDFAHDRHPREGASNPEPVQSRFWEAMIRSGQHAYAARQCLTKPSTWTELLAVVESLAAAMRSTIAG